MIRLRETPGRLAIWLCLALFAAANLHASPAEPLRPVGSGKFTWFGMTVYRATLLTADGSFSSTDRYALQIDYQFDFTRQQLARSSLEQIERLYGKQADGERLIQQLQAVFCDVRSGDHILGLHQPGEGAWFYNDEGLIGELDDPRLAQAFFDIWLAPGTSEPELRRQLLGLDP